MIQGLPRWTPPLITLVVLLALFPQVRHWDKERKIAVAVSDQQFDHELENKTDSNADAVGIIQTKINDLLSNSEGNITLNRTGNIRYSAQLEGDIYEAQFFVTSLNYFVSERSVTGECVGADCVTLAKKGTFSNEAYQTNQVIISLQSDEQGDKLIEMFMQYSLICQEDTQIDRGWRRKIKKIVDFFS